MGAVIKKIARSLYIQKKEAVENVPTSFFDIEVNDINRQPVKLEKYRGKKKAFLIVNIATGCQLTNQNFKELNQLYTSFRDKGLEILCFPTNDFYNREVRCNADIELYLKQHFQPDFPVFEKTCCNGPNPSPVYRYLRSNCKEFKVVTKDKIEYKTIPLTFAKFLLDGQGKVVGYFEPVVYPKKIIPDIEKLL